MAAEEAARLATEQAAAEEAAKVAADRLVTEQAAVEEAARVAADRLVMEQAAAEEVARITAEAAACLATEQAAAEEAARVAAARPPHLPPAREVKVDEKKMVAWKKWGGTELEAVLKTGAVALLDAEWVIAHAKCDGVLLPRQALPDKAFLLLGEVQARTAGISGGHLPIVCVSHCWLQPDHPDLHGYNLRAVARALASFTLKGERFGVFLDFCPIHQKCRDRDGVPQGRVLGYAASEPDAVGRFPAEDVLFSQALGSLGIFYAHAHTRVLMLTVFPPDYLTAKYKRSGNVQPYFKRGWCFCKSSWAMMVKDFSLVLDLGKHTGEGVFNAAKCMQGRKAPVLPEESVVQLESKGFTNGSTDKLLVADLYTKGFLERFGVVTLLVYTHLGWGGEEARAVAEALPHAPALEVLYLHNNSIGRRGRARAGRGAAARTGAEEARPQQQLDWRRGRARAGRGAAARAGAGEALSRSQLDWRRGEGSAAHGVGYAQGIAHDITTAGCWHPGSGLGRAF